MQLNLNSTELSVIREALADYMIFLRTVHLPTGEERLLKEAEFLEQASPMRKEHFLAAKGIRNHIRKNQF